MTRCNVILVVLFFSVNLTGAASSEAVLAIQGLDPVLLTKGKEVEGQEQHSVEHGRYRYRFSSAQSREEFLSDPARYEIQFSGACAAMTYSGAPAGSGDPARYHVYKERIYIFASDNCRKHFEQDPEGFLKDPDQ